MAGLRRIAVLGLLVVEVSGACRPKEKGTMEPGAPAGLPPADEARIRRVDSAFVAATNSGDAEAVAGVYADDGALLAPNLPPQRGRDAIKAFWGGFLDAYTVRFEVVSDTVEGRGDLAYNKGHYRFTAVPKAKGAPGVADEGKFIEVLRKQPDGSWKYVLDMYSSNLALQH